MGYLAAPCIEHRNGMGDFQVAPSPPGDTCLNRHPRRDRRETTAGLGRCRLIRTMDGLLSTGLSGGNPGSTKTG
jgi:hypothetical protein